MYLRQHAEHNSRSWSNNNIHILTKPVGLRDYKTVVLSLENKRKMKRTCTYDKIEKPHLHKV